MHHRSGATLPQATGHTNASDRASVSCVDDGVDLQWSSAAIITRSSRNYDAEWNQTNTTGPSRLIQKISSRALSKGASAKSCSSQPMSTLLRTANTCTHHTCTHDTAAVCQYDPATGNLSTPPAAAEPLAVAGARLCEVGRGAAWRREQSVSAVCVCVWASLFRCGEWRGQSRGGRDSVGITQLVLAASAFLSRLLALTQRTPLGGSPLRADSPKKN